MLDSCLTLQDVLEPSDSHREQIWEEASDADEAKILISRAYKPLTHGRLFDPPARERRRRSLRMIGAYRRLDGRVSSLPSAHPN
jgi:hypothetical protein